MNTSIAKEIRKILNYDPNLSDATSKRVYSRAKKQSTNLAKAQNLCFYKNLEIYITKINYE